jgi:hypothetical protein
VIEQEGYGMREDFAQQPTAKVPHIARPHLLHGVASCELAENGVYPVAKPTEEGTPSGIRVEFLGGVGSQKLYTPMLARCSVVLGEW